MKEMLFPNFNQIMVPDKQLFTPDNRLHFKNKFRLEHIRDGKVIDVDEFYNDIVTEGKNSLLDIMFGAATQLTSWYVGLIDNSGFSALAATDVMNSHVGWTEFTNYSQANRVTWTTIAASAGSKTNTTSMVFDITGSGTLYGGFVTSNNTKGGTSGKLWATAAFNTTKPVTNGDQIKLTYTVSC